MSGYYLVRPQSPNIFESIFDKKNVVGVGWSEVDFFSCKDGTEVHDKVYDVYYKGQPYFPATVSRWCNQAARFKDIKAGAKIIVPLPYELALAKAKGQESYDKTLIQPLDVANLQLVEYKRDAAGNVARISRSRLSHGLQSRLRMMGSICLDLDDFATEIDYLFQYGEDAYETAFSNSLNDKMAEARKCLLENIQKGKTQLQAGGAGFEGLICALLQCIGYDNARILPKNDLPAGCDADVIASRYDNILGEIKILAQVKHHTGVSGKTGVAS
ncbi:MAG: restriction endonuclease [Desulfovibrio sp.]|nr:restriction endonuclease [Desulfovibrio sp.]